MTDRTHADLRGEDCMAASVRIARCILGEMSTGPIEGLLASYATRRLGEQLNWSPERIEYAVQTIGLAEG